ncbi:uncharacterized protein LOC134689907 [Mytilus trossulus]|uniref:uncharacterized protein LOC134689907 n=1 Tax=Mytilus trossulus TaxID=6551 RepID=UPI00300419F5
MTREERTCEMCDETEVHSRCEDCDQNMCKNCHDYYLKNTTFKKHKIEDNKNKEVSEDERISKDIECDKHTKQLSLYCKSCNLPICEECKTSDHACHKTEKIDIVIKAMKSTLKTSIISLKSKIPFLDNIVENAKSEENKYWKDIRQMQAEVRSVASSLKDLVSMKSTLNTTLGSLNSKIPFLDNVIYNAKTEENRYGQDIHQIKGELDIMIEKLETLETFAYADKHTFETYIEEVKQNRLSIIRLIESIEATIKFGKTTEVVRLCSVLGTDIHMYTEEYPCSELKLYLPMFKPGILRDHQIHDSFGTIERDNIINVLLKPQFPCHQIHRSLVIKHLPKKSRFQSKTGQNYTSIVAVGDFHVCVTNLLSTKSYAYYGSIGHILILDTAGESKQVISRSMGNKFYIIGVNARTCFLWNSDKIESIQMQTEEKFATTITLWENDIQGLSPEGRGCIMVNGNMLGLLKEKFYEVEKTGKTVRTFTSDAISQLANSQPSCILCTKTKMILVGYNHTILAITLSGDIRYTHTFKGSNINSMCNDRHGNVFMADSSNHHICMLTSDGHFIRSVLNSENGITTPSCLTIDGRGNLWILTTQNKTIHDIVVFSYL